MIRIGAFNVMNIAGSEREFFVLELDGQTALLPKAESGKGLRIGGSARVFVYNNGPDELRGTFAKPYAAVDETAFLRVREALGFGAFLDWGIPKDLFVPKRCQTGPLEKGDMCIVRICPDPDGGGVIGDCRFKSYFSGSVPSFRVGEEVGLLVYEKTKLGYNAVVNNDYTGLLYHNELYSDIVIGKSLPGYIKKIREDGGIDLTLQRQGVGGIADAADEVMKALAVNGGFIPLHDKSSPGEIQEKMGMSKKAFKRAVGSLYKKKLVSIDPDGIRMLNR